MVMIDLVDVFILFAFALTVDYCISGLIKKKLNK